MKVVLVILAILVALFGGLFLNAFLIMVLAGALFPLWGWSTIGYGTSLLLTLALGVVGSFFRGISHASS